VAFVDALRRLRQHDALLLHVPEQKKVSGNM
jgi:hypothetical protein